MQGAGVKGSCIEIHNAATHIGLHVLNVGCDNKQSAYTDSGGEKHTTRVLERKKVGKHRASVDPDHSAQTWNAGNTHETIE